MKWLLDHKNDLKRVLFPVGSLLTVALCAALIYELLQTRALDQIAWNAVRTWVVLAVCAVAYAVSQLLLVVSWKIILDLDPVRRIRMGEAIGVYGVAQAYKYLPSNLLHQVGRYVLLRKRGYVGSWIVQSSVWENVCLLAAAVFAGMVFARLDTWSRALSRIHTAAPVVLLALFVMIVVLAYLRFWRPELCRKSVRSIARVASSAFGLDLFFFIGTGTIFFQLAAIVPKAQDALSPLTYIGALSIAWVLGFVVPGASAGIGVRETTIAAIFGGVGHLDEGLALAVAYRIATISGDVLFAGVGWLFLRGAMNQGAQIPRVVAVVAYNEPNPSEPLQ